MENTTNDLEIYAAALIAKGKALRGALRMRARNLQHCDKRGASQAYRDETEQTHEAEIAAIASRAVLPSKSGAQTQT